MYEFGRINADGSKTIIGFVDLLPDGKIGGYKHYNETFWEEKDGIITFKNGKGEPTTIFDNIEPDDTIVGEWEIENIETKVKEKMYFYDNEAVITESNKKGTWKQDDTSIIVTWDNGEIEQFNKS